LLCAAANSVGELIAFRAVQGLGGGGLMSFTIVALGHLRHERPDPHGYGGGNMMAAALVGIGLVLGPTVGGQIVEHLSWRWVFLINLPLGGLAWAVAWSCMRVPHHDEPTPLDLLGSALLALVAACLLLACQWGGLRYAWGSWQILGLGTLGLVAVCAFVIRQLRTAAPLFPVRVIALHNVRAIASLQLLTGIGMTGSAIYMTIELQLVHGISPAATGVRLLPMAAGLAIGSIVGPVAAIALDADAGDRARCAAVRGDVRRAGPAGRGRLVLGAGVTPMPARVRDRRRHGHRGDRAPADGRAPPSRDRDRRRPFR
jgi:MFS family permease